MKVIKTGVLFVVLAALVICLVRASDKMGSGQQAESLKQLDASIRKATMTCYATEGVYPPSVQYLKENYGIQIDEDRYSVFYEIEGANLMPSITVMEND
ncbi:MAG: hypothetical protein J6C32_05925 [Eubacterium sp.]|nr:hypothetical protein [Eubacterium sp.]